MVKTDNAKISSSMLFSVIGFLIIAIGGICNAWYNQQFDSVRLDIKQLSAEATEDRKTMNGMLLVQNEVLITMKSYIKTHTD